VLALIRVAPQALALKSPHMLKREIAERRKAQHELEQMRTELERRVVERTAELERTNEILKAEASQREHAESALRQSMIEQQKAEVSLREADRRKDEFLAILGHELRNPLAGIAGAIQVLDMAGTTEPEGQEMRGIIRRQSQHMGRLIDDLLEVSRISRGKFQLRMEPVDLTQLVRRTCEDLRRHVEDSGLALDVDLASEPLWINGDPTRLAQILVNLMNNAVKFTSSGGTVTVRLGPDEKGITVSLTVSDTGIGMEPGILTCIFEPFRQVQGGSDRGQGGLGLGLALVKGLTELHSGRVEASSAGPGQGSAFRIELPLIRPPEPAHDPASSHSSADQCFRVLIIDDRRDATYPLQTLLKKLGHQVEIAEDGAQGIERARQFLPDLVLCDIGLPDMSGFDVAQALRSEPDTRQAYLVAVTGYGQEEDLRRSMGAGFDRHLIKPLGMPVLKELLATLSAALKAST
jgi:signal transduction histidine kinase/ActR/RegA family two-component response regulator